MSEKNIENWEKELKDQLGSHKEPTDASDFNAFMDKLEDNNFFDQKRKRFSGKWILLTGISVTIGIIWLWINQYDGGEKLESLTPQVSTSPMVELNDQEDSIEEESLEVLELSERLEPVSLPDPEKISQLREETMVEGELEELIPDVSNQEDEIENIEQFIDSSLEDTEVDQEKVVIQREPIIIMSTDTTVVVDTNHIKHREKNKRKRR